MLSVIRASHAGLVFIGSIIVLCGSLLTSSAQHRDEVVAGLWGSNVGLSYVISELPQSEGEFTWWVDSLRQHGQGRVTGEFVTANWRDEAGTAGSATGRVAAWSSGRAARIEWDNGVVFQRLVTQFATYAELGRLPTNQPSVCWAAGSDTDPVQRQEVRNTVQEWEDASALDFQWLGDCPPPTGDSYTQDIRILFDEPPPCIPNPLGTGDEICFEFADVPGFEGCNAKELSGTYWSFFPDDQNRQKCEYTMRLGPAANTKKILHEFGHALGLRHEHERVDATCTEGGQPFMGSSRRITDYYDEESVMHYTISTDPDCQVFPDPGSRGLSDGDRLAVAVLYPVSRRPELVGCFTTVAGESLRFVPDWVSRGVAVDEIMRGLTWELDGQVVSSQPILDVIRPSLGSHFLRLSFRDPWGDQWIGGYQIHVLPKIPGSPRTETTMALFGDRTGEWIGPDYVGSPAIETQFLHRFSADEGARSNNTHTISIRRGSDGRHRVNGTIAERIVLNFVAESDRHYNSCVSHDVNTTVWQWLGSEWAIVGGPLPRIMHVSTVPGPTLHLDPDGKTYWSEGGGSAAVQIIPDELPTGKSRVAFGARYESDIKEFSFEVRSNVDVIIVDEVAPSPQPCPPGTVGTWPNCARITEAPLDPDRDGGQSTAEIGGRWNSNIGLVYEIEQTGWNCSWTVTSIGQKAKCSIDGDSIEAYWYDAGVTAAPSGQAKGFVTRSATGAVIRINWDNGVEFTRSGE